MSVSSLDDVQACGVDPAGPEAPRRARLVAAPAALELDRRPTALLTFGSQLLHGSVGLNAAGRVFADYGVRTIQVPTILLSALPHHARVHEVQIPTSWLSASLEELTASGAMRDLRLVTTGYFASPGQPAAVADWYEKLPIEHRPPLIVDPVLGDTDLGFYTLPALAGTIREELFPLAMGVTPNLFELAQLSGVPVEDLNSHTAIEAAARSIMGDFTEWVIVTGIRFPPTALEVGGPASSHIGEILVRRASSSTHRLQAAAISPKGLGDTFAAVLAAALLDGYAIAEAVDFAAAEVYARTQALRTSPAAP